MHRGANRNLRLVKQGACNPQDIGPSSLHGKVGNRSGIGFQVSPFFDIKVPDAAVVETPPQHGLGIALSGEILMRSVLPVIENAVAALKLCEKSAAPHVDNIASLL